MTGILAIPAAVIGLVYSWVLIKKTRLEAAKLTAELEVEKQHQTASFESSAATPTVSPPATSSLSALARGTIPYLLLRYVLLELVLALWGYVTSLYSFMFGLGAAYGFEKFSSGHSSSQLWIYAPMAILGLIPKIGDFLIFLSIGWPLFKDANAIIGIDLRSVFRWKRNA